MAKLAGPAAVDALSQLNKRFQQSSDRLRRLVADHPQLCALRFEACSFAEASLQASHVDLIPI